LPPREGEEDAETLRVLLSSVVEISLLLEALLRES